MIWALRVSRNLIQLTLHWFNKSNKRNVVRRTSVDMRPSPFNAGESVCFSFINERYFGGGSYAHCSCSAALHHYAGTNYDTKICHSRSDLRQMWRAKKHSACWKRHFHAKIAIGAKFPVVFRATRREELTHTHGCIKKSISPLKRLVNWFANAGSQSQRLNAPPGAILSDSIVGGRLRSLQFSVQNQNERAERELERDAAYLAALAWATLWMRHYCGGTFGQLHQSRACAINLTRFEN